MQYSCVNAPDIEELEYVIDNARKISYDVFLKNINKKEFEELIIDMGYTKLSGGVGLHIKDDYHVSFYVSKLSNGKKVYFMDHSAIEYVFY